jgi:acetylornithine deacetylase/succinyl-diaminopimelate desuccinylase-like protein
VLPTTAEATINCRILPGETRAQVRAALVKVIADSNVAVVDGHWHCERETAKRVVRAMSR